MDLETLQETLPIQVRVPRLVKAVELILEIILIWARRALRVVLEVGLAMLKEHNREKMGIKIITYWWLF